jgi:dTDP-4-dehydrorhamnose reductase
MKILITGANGLLGQKIVNQLIKNKVDFLATSLGENRNSKCPNNKYQTFDITNASETEKIVSNYQPTHIINTAAITNVDFCEDHQELCQKVNIDAVNNLFQICKQFNIHLTHLSTDFVFDGENGPYKETDQPNPLSIYAKSKYKSEQILLNDAYKNWAIVRTIIVYGQGENLSRSNIVLWAKSALAEGTPLTIVDDQYRAPTWADDLAWACIQIAKKNAKGIYHVSGPKTMSIYNMVLIIAETYGFDKSLITPIKSSTLNQKAPRPPKTGFIIDKAKNDLGYQPKTFDETLILID